MSSTHPKSDQFSKPEDKALEKIEECLVRSENLLALSALGLEHVPKEIGRLVDLEGLDLYTNNLSELPLEISQLKSLRKLFLHSNRFTSVPTEVLQLRSLDVLDLSNNKLTSLPSELREFANLEALYLHDNPDLGLPDEILGPTWAKTNAQNPATPPAEILDYYFRIHPLDSGGMSETGHQRSKARPLLEGRIIVIGDGKVGKTSLIGQLLHKRKAKQREPSTRLVAVQPWSVKLEKDTVQTYVWDFGGQEQLHAAHPYFFTERTLYLVVADARESLTEERLNYWLSMVAAHGQGARALVVVNQIDQHPMDVDRRGLCARHACLPEEPKAAFFGTSCITGEGISELEKAIRFELGKLSDIYALTPKEWFEVKKELADMRLAQIDTISFEEWRNLCIKAGVTVQTDQDRLLSLMRDLGQVVAFPMKRTLRPLGVLNPEWVTNAIYTLLTSPQLAESRGLLRIEDLGNLLPTDRYPPERHGWLVELMKSFELIFSDEAGRLLLPARLPKETPDWALQLCTGDQVLCLEMRYPVLPEAIISRFIVRTHRDEWQSGSWWRHGIALRQERCTAMVRAIQSEGKIEMRVSGPRIDRSSMIWHLYRTLIDIGRDLSGGDLWVIIASGVAAKYNDLLLLAEAGERQYRFVVDGAVQSIDMRAVLGLFTTDEQQTAALSEMRHRQLIMPQIINFNNSDGNIAGDGKEVRFNRSFNQGISGDELESLFRQVVSSAEMFRSKIAPEDIKTLASYVEIMRHESKKTNPSAGLLQITGKGLEEAAKTMATIAPPVLTAARAVLKFLNIIP